MPKPTSNETTPPGTEPKSLTTRQFSEALGAESIYVGTSNPLDALSGALQHRIRVAKRAREIAAEESDSPIHLALRGLTQIVDGDIGYALEDQREGERDNLANLIARFATHHSNDTP